MMWHVCCPVGHNALMSGDIQMSQSQKRSEYMFWCSRKRTQTKSLSRKIPNWGPNAFNVGRFFQLWSTELWYLSQPPAPLFNIYNILYSIFCILHSTPHIQHSTMHKVNVQCSFPNSAQLNPAAPLPLFKALSSWGADASLNSRVLRSHCFWKPLSEASCLGPLTTHGKPFHAVHITNVQCRRKHLKPGTQYTLKCAQWVEISPHRWCSRAVGSLPNTRLLVMRSFVCFPDDYTIPHILKFCQCFLLHGFKS